jgi:hypothetical protein
MIKRGIRARNPCVTSDNNWQTATFCPSWLPYEVSRHGAERETHTHQRRHVCRLRTMAFFSLSSCSMSFLSSVCDCLSVSTSLLSLSLSSTVSTISLFNVVIRSCFLGQDPSVSQWARSVFAKPSKVNAKGECLHLGEGVHVLYEETTGQDGNHQDYR